MINDNYKTSIIYRFNLRLNLPTLYVEIDTSKYPMFCFNHNKLTSYNLWIITYNITIVNCQFTYYPLN